MIPLVGYTRPRSQGLSLLASRLIWKHGKCPGNPQRFSSGLHSPQSSIVETVKKKKSRFSFAVQPDTNVPQVVRRSVPSMGIL